LGRGESSHIAEHDVSPEEAEQVVLNDPVDLEVQIRNGEERTVQIGETNSGRVLVVVTTWRDGSVRVITAFPANKKLRTLYESYREKDGEGAENS
jgi:uncharacterized protein